MESPLACSTTTVTLIMLEIYFLGFILGIGAIYQMIKETQAITLTLKGIEERFTKEKNEKVLTAMK